MLLFCLGQKGGKKSRAHQFPKHIWSVFVKWLSSNLHAFVCMCVCLSQIHFVDDAVTAAGILDVCQSLSKQKEETIYHLLSSNMHIHKGIHSSKSCRLLPPLFAHVWPWWAVWTLVGTESV